jgi:D-glycero-D-manno-heptose 1,7-bisphosphate phosphatase
MTTHPRKLSAVFLDRDGVLNEEVGYICRPEQLKLIAGSGTAVKRLNDHGFVVVVVSNQSGIGRGICSDAEIQQVNVSLSKQLSLYGAQIARFYYCPHHPTEAKGEYLITCDCRKPRPGMLHQAATDLNLDLKTSVMVGDRESDIQAGRSAGCNTVLIKSNPRSERWYTPNEDQTSPHLVVFSLSDAVNWIIDKLDDRRPALEGT